MELDHDEETNDIFASDDEEDTKRIIPDPTMPPSQADSIEHWVQMVCSLLPVETSTSLFPSLSQLAAKKKASSLTTNTLRSVLDKVFLH